MSNQAFPFVIPRDGNRKMEVITGMSLRDYFAGQALAGMLSNESVEPNSAAAFAWQYADKMIEVRNAIDRRCLSNALEKNRQVSAAIEQ